MHLTQAYDLLEIIPEMTLDEMKRQYKKKALRFHPDKNKSADASDRFREIHDAYQTVLKRHAGEDTSYDSFAASGAKGAYKDLLFSFLSHFFVSSDEPDMVFTAKIRMVFSRLVCMCESKAMDYVQKLDRDVLSYILSTIRQSREIFHFSDVFLECIERIIATRSDEPGCILLNPCLEDLLDDNLYRFTRNGISYVVPLWHQELVYDFSGSELVVQCSPVLPDYMEMDEENHLVIYLDYDIREIWGKTAIDVVFGGKTVSFQPSTLHLTTDTQTIVFANRGISRINAEDVFDVSVKQDVILKIQLFMEE